MPPKRKAMRGPKPERTPKRVSARLRGQPPSSSSSSSLEAGNTNLTNNRNTNKDNNNNNTQQNAMGLKPANEVDGDEVASIAGSVDQHLQDLVIAGNSPGGTELNTEDVDQEDVDMDEEEQDMSVLEHNADEEGDDTSTGDYEPREDAPGVASGEEEDEYFTNPKEEKGNPELVQNKKNEEGSKNTAVQKENNPDEECQGNGSTNNSSNNNDFGFIRPEPWEPGMGISYDEWLYQWFHRPHIMRDVAAVDLATASSTESGKQKQKETLQPTVAAAAASGPAASATATAGQNLPTAVQKGNNNDEEGQGNGITNNSSNNNDNGGGAPAWEPWMNMSQAEHQRQMAMFQWYHREQIMKDVAAVDLATASSAESGKQKQKETLQPTTAAAAASGPAASATATAGQNMSTLQQTVPSNPGGRFRGVHPQLWRFQRPAPSTAPEGIVSQMGSKYDMAMLEPGSAAGSSKQTEKEKTTERRGLTGLTPSSLFERIRNPRGPTTSISGTSVPATVGDMTQPGTLNPRQLGFGMKLPAKLSSTSGQPAASAADGSKSTNSAVPPGHPQSVFPPPPSFMRGLLGSRASGPANASGTAIPPNVPGTLMSSDAARRRYSGLSNLGQFDEDDHFSDPEFVRSLLGRQAGVSASASAYASASAAAPPKPSQPLTPEELAKRDPTMSFDESTGEWSCVVPLSYSMKNPNIAPVSTTDPYFNRFPGANLPKPAGTSGGYDYREGGERTNVELPRNWWMQFDRHMHFLADQLEQGGEDGPSDEE